MARLRSIDIDFDVHRAIEVQRQDFDDTPNDVLRRLLKLPAQAPESELPAEKGWTGEGVFLPNGTKATITYRKKTTTAEIKNGKWVMGGRIFYSPSDAASAAAVTKKGTHPSLNGWLYWRVKRPEDDSFLLIDELRPKDE